MSLKEIMKLRMTISTKTTIVIVGDPNNNTSRCNVIDINETTTLEKNFDIEEWRRKLDNKLKDETLSFHYNES